MARPGGPVSVCVINLKGGVGKSTISALLARQAFTDHNLDVLAIDLDPQSNLSQALMHSSANPGPPTRTPSIVERFNGYRPTTARSVGRSRPAPSDAVVAVARAPNRPLQLIPPRCDFLHTLIAAVT